MIQPIDITYYSREWINNLTKYIEHSPYSYPISNELKQIDETIIICNQMLDRYLHLKSIQVLVIQQKQQELQYQLDTFRLILINTNQPITTTFYYQHEIQLIQKRLFVISNLLDILQLYPDKIYTFEQLYYYTKQMLLTR